MSDIASSRPLPAAYDETPAAVRRRIASIFGGSIGNLIEWYDFYVFSAFTPYFAKQFSAAQTQSSQYLEMLGIFALGFFIRPIGSWVLGSYADKHGRRAALTLGVTLMCLGSLMIGVLPTYAQVGVTAPWLLLIARLVQGFSLGGEYGASATYLSEVAGSRRRGFYSSFQYVTLIGGMLLATTILLVMQQILTEAQLKNWGWRVPFLIGAACALYGFYLRRNLPETDDFKQVAQTRRPNPIGELLRHPREIGLVFGLTMGGTLAFYTYTAYMQTFLSDTVGLTKPQTTTISVITLLIYAAMQPVFGLISDKIGRRPVLLWFGVMGTLFTYLIFNALIHTRDYYTAMFLILAALMIVSGYTSINSVVKAELFPAGVRALGVGLPYALANSLFGGTASYVAQYFKVQGHQNWFPIYVTAITFISLVVYATMRDTKKESRIEG